MIGSYGLLGDCRTAVLSGPDGSIDWWCLPRFDGEPVFARLLAGDRDGGCFRLQPAGSDVELVSREYMAGTPILTTTWRVGAGELTLSEGLVGDVSGRLLPTELLVRRLCATGSAVDVQVLFDPRHGADRRAPSAAELWCAPGRRRRWR